MRPTQQKGRDRFVYQAVDSTGQTIDFLLTNRRDAAAAKRFLRRALRSDNSVPRGINTNVDKNPAYPLAITSYALHGIVSNPYRYAYSIAPPATSAGSMTSIPA
jgi:transposase-like protein